MRQIPRLRQTSSLLCSAAAPSLQRDVFCRASTSLLRHQFSITAAPHETSPGLDKWRRRLWKGEPAGAEDPYTGHTEDDKRAILTQSAELQELGRGGTDDYTIEEHVNIETDFSIPPELRSAARPEEIDDPQYVPAESAEGLDEVGDLADWWENESHWSSSKNFVGFGPRRKIHDASVLEVLTRRAVTEALVVRHDDPELLTALWERGGKEDLTRALSLGIEVAEDGSARLTGDAGAVVRYLRWEPAEESSQEVAAEATSELSADEAREFLKSWDQSWKNVSLEDAHLKFAVTKRILQLTGQVIPDSKLPSIRTAKTLLSVLVRPPRAKKLSEAIQIQGDLSNLPNVTVFPRRVTPIDKDKMIGRWKIIARELEKRGLPVTGTSGYTKHKEKEYFQGKA